MRTLFSCKRDSRCVCKAFVDMIQIRYWKLLGFGPGEEFSLSASADPYYHWPQPVYPHSHSSHKTRPKPIQGEEITTIVLNRGPAIRIDYTLCRGCTLYPSDRRSRVRRRCPPARACPLAPTPTATPYQGNDQSFPPYTTYHVRTQSPRA